MSTSYAVVRNNDRCRAGVLIFVLVLAVVLQGFGTGYYQIVPNNTNNGYYIDLWVISACSLGTCGYPTTVVNYTVCLAWATNLKAAAAFYVMADIVVYFALVFAFLEFFAVGPQWIGVFLSIVYVIFSIIGWAIIAGFYRQSYCGITLSNGHQLYAGWATAVAGSGIVLIAVIFWFIRACCCNPKRARLSAPAAVAVAAPVTYAAAPVAYATAAPAVTYATAAPAVSYGSPYAAPASVTYRTIA